MITYRKLRELKVNSKKTWQDIRAETGLSHTVIARINKDEYVSLQSVETLAEYFKVDIGDVVEIKKKRKK